MATFNFNVKIKTGKRTPIEVGCYWTAVNNKTVELFNSDETTTVSAIAEFIQKSVEKALKERAAKIK
jgi:hypothetical protein